MRTTRRPAAARLTATLAALAVTAGAGTLAPRAAAAQTAGHAVAPAAAPRVDVPVGALVRAVATLHLAQPRPHDLPAQITVSDSAGVLVASYRSASERVVRPLLVTAMETDLVLQGETAGGLLTIRLDRANDAPGDTVTGQWWLGDRRGALRGRTRR